MIDPPHKFGAKTLTQKWESIIERSMPPQQQPQNEESIQSKKSSSQFTTTKRHIYYYCIVQSPCKLVLAVLQASSRLINIDTTEDVVTTCKTAVSTTKRDTSRRAGQHNNQFLGR